VQVGSGASAGDELAAVASGDQVDVLEQRSTDSIAASVEPSEPDALGSEIQMGFLASRADRWVFDDLDEAATYADADIEDVVDTMTPKESVEKLITVVASEITAVRGIDISLVNTFFSCCLL